MSNDAPERTDADVLAHMGTDPARWAAEFVHRRKTRDMDEGAMISWFGNALMAGRDAGRRQTCPHGNVWTYAGEMVLCNTCGAGYDKASGTWA